MPESGPIPSAEIIVREDNAEKDWREVARRVYHGILDVFPEILVDIIDGEGNVEPRHWPVLKGDSIFAKWERIAAGILESLDFSRWTSLLEV